MLFLLLFFTIMTAPEEVTTEDPGVVTTIMFTGTEAEVTTAAPTSPPPGEYQKHQLHLVNMTYTSSPWRVLTTLATLGEYHTMYISSPS